MRTRVVSLLGLTAVLATAVAADAAGEAQAPPTLTPLVARDVTAVCPGTARYAQALATGISESDAAAAAPLFDACAAALRRDTGELRRQIASTAVGATYLSLGLLRHDPALLRRSIDATAEVRGNYDVRDEDIRRWPIIPDQYDARRREAIVYTECAAGGLAADAAYINVAAHAGTAWVSTPRAAMSCPPRRIDPNVAVWTTSTPKPSPFGIPATSGRPNPAIQPDEAHPNIAGQAPPLGSSH